MPVICRFPTGTKVDTQLSETSENPIANSTVTKAINLSNEKIDELNGVTLTGTLVTGQTELVFEDERITEDSVLNAVYASIFDVATESAEVGEGILTLTFAEQEEDMIVKVVLDANLSCDGSGDSSSEGIPGKDGKDGKDGVDGKSAYQYAVDGGFEGTEEEFMTLLGGISNSGNPPTEGESEWELLGSVTNNTAIQLPDNWTELHILMYDNTKDDMGINGYYSKQMLQDICNSENVATINLGIPSSNNRCDYNSTSNTITPLMLSGTIGDNVTTKVYYRKKSPLTVDVGAESNWALWGEVAYSTAFNLPSDWEEIMCVMLDRTSVVINKQQIENKSVVYHQYKFNYYTDKWNEGILHYNSELNSVSCNECSFKIYYKKKCDNVLDINDVGRWTELKSYNASNTNVDITDIFGYNEVCFSAYNTSDSGYPMVSSTYVVDQLKDNTALISVSGCTTNSRHYSLKLFRSSNYYTISKSEYTQDNTLYNTNVKVSIYVR